MSVEECHQTRSVAARYELKMKTTAGHMGHGAMRHEIQTDHLAHRQNLGPVDPAVRNSTSASCYYSDHRPTAYMPTSMLIVDAVVEIRKRTSLFAEYDEQKMRVNCI